MKEIGQATATNPYSRGGLLPLYGGDDGVDVVEGGEACVGDSDSISPPIFARTASVSVFRVSLRLVSRSLRGGLYIGVFRSS
jgi:hypothetical protein